MKTPIKDAAGIASELTREECRIYEFLLRLDDAADTVEVTDWEASFIGDLLDHPRSLTPAQRAKCDELRTEYEGRL